MALGISIPRAAANSVASISQRGGYALPSQLTVAVTPGYNRIAVQVTEDSAILSGHHIEGEVDATSSRGRHHVGTHLYSTYDTDDYYANVLNLPEATDFSVLLTVRLVSDTTGAVVATFREFYSTTTLDSSNLIDESNRRVCYVDAVNGSNTLNDGLTPATPKANLDGSGTSVTDLILAANDTGWDIVIMNGDWPNATTSTRRLIGIRGAANNWHRIMPYDSNARFSCEVDLDGTWNDEGSGVFSMELNKSTQISSANTLPNVYDSTTELQLYPYKTRAAFEAAAIGDGTGYYIDNANPAAPDPDNNPTYADAADILYVRLVSGANPGTGRLKGAFGSGLILQDCQYVLVEDMPFVSCGIRSQSNGSLGEAGIRINALNVATGDIIIRGCTFERNSTDIAIEDVSANETSNVLIDDNDFIFDGPWDHLMAQFDYTEADPYVFADSWSHIKSSAWETFAVSLTGHAGIVSRNNYCRGKQYINGAGGDATNMKHFHSQGDVIEECWDDAIGDFEGSAFVNAVVLDCTVRDSVTMIAWTPSSSGPFWLANAIGDGIVHYPFKIGTQTSTTTGHGYKLISNISVRAKGFGSPSSQTNVGNMYILNGASGVEMTNVVMRSVQTGDAADEVYFVQSGGASAGPIYTVEEDRLNVWRNVLIYMENRDTPIAPIAVYWRNAAGVLTEYATFDAATAAIGDTDTSWIDVVGTTSNGGGVDPFPTSVAAGLNSLITTKSIGVRGVTDLAADVGESRIGAFELAEA